jgi:hypothetical protein
LSEHF